MPEKPTLQIHCAKFSISTLKRFRNQMKSLQSVLQQSGFYGHFVPRTKSYFAPWKDKGSIVLTKFLVQSEITCYTWKLITMDETTGLRQSCQYFHSVKSTSFQKLERCEEVSSRNSTHRIPSEQSLKKNMLLLLEFLLE